MHLHQHSSMRVACSTLLVLALMCLSSSAQLSKRPEPGDVAIKNGTVFTITHGTIQNGTVIIRKGKIAEVGANLPIPAGMAVIDATGKFVMPGIIDSHAHMALDGDVNEATSPVTPHMKMADAFDYTDRAMYYALAGGVTSAMLLHGSANMIGGEAAIVKLRFGLDRDDMFFEGAPRSIKFASGENPKRVYGGRNQLPSTRMGNFEVQRAALQEAREYMRDWDAYEAKVKVSDKDAKAPKRDLKLEELADVLRGKVMVQIHCYRADEFLTEMAIAKEFGYNLRGFHHGLEVYKVADKVAAGKVGLATFADWWGFKIEAWDAIPWNAVMSMRKGVVVAIKSDSNDYVRRLNQEAAKTVRYGGATDEEALRMITLNAAWIVGIENRVGSIDVGKDADIVIWNNHPLSSFAKTEKVLIDGNVYFDSSLPGYGLTFWRGGPMTGGNGFGNDDGGADGGRR